MRPSDGGSAQGTLVVGLEAEPEYLELAEEIAENLPEELGERFEDFEWRVEVREIPPKDPAANSTDFVLAARELMLAEDWDLAVCLTALPLRAHGRPVTAHVSPSHGVGLISVPAFGALGVEDRVREAVLDLVSGLVGVRGEAEDGDRERIRDRLQELAAPLGEAQVRDDGRIRFTTAVIRGNLRLLSAWCAPTAPPGDHQAVAGARRGARHRRLRARLGGVLEPRGPDELAPPHRARARVHGR